MSKNEKPSSRFRRFSLPVALGTVLIVLAATFNAASAMPPLQADGEALFTSKGCNACHTIGGGDLVGPDLAGVTELRTQEWLTNWLIAPDQMLQTDPRATGREKRRPKSEKRRTCPPYLGNHRKISRAFRHPRGVD